MNDIAQFMKALIGAMNETVSSGRIADLIDQHCAVVVGRDLVFIHQVVIDEHQVEHDDGHEAGIEAALFYRQLVAVCFDGVAHPAVGSRR